MIKEVVYLAVTDLHETYHLSMWCWKKPALKIILQFISNLREKYMTTFPKGRFLWYSGDKLRINKASIVVNSHFSRRPDGCWECCHNFALLNHLYHIWELSNEVLYDSVLKGVSKIQQVKVEHSTFTKSI